MAMPSFNPTSAPVEISVSNASQRVRVATQLTINVLVTVRVVNDGSATVWIRGGDSNVDVTSTPAQTNTGIRVPAGSTEVLSFKPGSDGVLWIAAIAAASTGSIEFTAGQGL